MPRMMITTRSSIRVKPCSEPRRVLRRVIIERASPCIEDGGWLTSYRRAMLIRASPVRGIRLPHTERANAPKKDEGALTRPFGGPDHSRRDQVQMFARTFVTLIWPPGPTL